MKNWSYSRYSTWKKCPALLKFQMEATEPAPSHPAAQRGTDLHAVIEQYLLGKGKLPLELDYYRPFFDHIRNEGAQPEVPLSVDSEWRPIGWDDPGRWWRGILDCVVETEDECYIFDWKTGNEYGDHRDQREIYAAAKFSHDSEYPEITVIHVYLDKKQNTVSRFTPEDIPAIQRGWTVRIEEMFNDKRMAPNPGFYCRTCHFRRDNGGPCHF